MNIKHFTFALAAILFSAASQAQTTLFADLGGDKGITKIVAGAIKRWEQNPALAEAFKNADTERLEKMLVLQFCSITGGGCKYEGGDMKTVHEKMGVDTRQFNALAEDLQISLAENGVAGSTQNRLIALLAPMKRDVVTK
jgi:hemoglobin